MESERNAEVVFLRLVLPGQPERNIGLFLLDRQTGSLYFRLREDWDRIAAPDDAELLSQLNTDFQQRIQELGEGAGDRFLKSLEDQLSNILRLTDRALVPVKDMRAELDKLFAESCAAV